MQGMSERQYAAHVGLSRGAIQKAKSAGRLVLHDAKGQLHALAARGSTDLAGVQLDTALAAYLVRPDQRSYDLADLTLRHLQRELRVEGAGDGQGMLDFTADQDAEAQASMVRARAVLDLSAVLDELDIVALLAVTGESFILRSIWNLAASAGADLRLDRADLGVAPPDRVLPPLSSPPPPP